MLEHLFYLQKSFKRLGTINGRFRDEESYMTAEVCVMNRDGTSLAADNLNQRLAELEGVPFGQGTSESFDEGCSSSVEITVNGVP